MTKNDFQWFVRNLINLEKSAAVDAQTAADVRPFDPQLAAMVQTMADTKLAIHNHIEKKRER